MTQPPELEIKVLRPEGTPKGRIALVIDEKWAADIARVLLDFGFELISIPGWLFRPAELRADKAEYYAFTRKLRSLLQSIPDIILILDINGSLMFTDPSTPLGSDMGIPTVCYWLDDPKLCISDVLRYDVMPIYPFLKNLSNPLLYHFFIDVSMQREYKHFLSVDHAFHLPSGASVTSFTPNFNKKKDIDFIFVGNCFDDDLGHLLNRSDIQSIFTPLLDPIYHLKRQNLDQDFRAILNQFESKESRRIKTVFDAPMAPEHFDTYFYTWCTVSTHWATIRNDIIQTMATTKNLKFKLHGKLWDTKNIPNDGFLNGNSAIRNTLVRSKWGLNAIYGQEQSGLPVRIFEHAGCGLPTITQSCEELPLHFEPGRECVSFSSVDELPEILQKTQALTPSDTCRMGEAMHHRFLNEHTWHHRVHTLLSELQHFIPALSVVKLPNVRKTLKTLMPDSR